MASLPFENGVSNNIVALPNGHLLVHQHGQIIWLFDSQSKLWSAPTTVPSQKHRNIVYGFMNEISNGHYQLFGFHRGTISIWQIRQNPLQMTLEREWHCVISASIEPVKIHYIDGKFHIWSWRLYVVLSDQGKELQCQQGIFGGGSSVYSPKTKSLFSFAATKEAQYPPVPSTMVAECQPGDKKWNFVDSMKLPIPLRNPVAVCTTNGEFCIILGGISTNNLGPRWSINYQIFVFNTMTKQCRTSAVTLRRGQITTRIAAAIVSNSKNDGLVVVGYIRRVMAKIQVQFPDDLIEYMVQWISTEYLHIFDGPSVIHSTFNVDDVLCCY